MEVDDTFSIINHNVKNLSRSFEKFRWINRQLQNLSAEKWSNLEFWATHNLAPSSSRWNRAVPGKGRMIQAKPMRIAAHGYFPINAPNLKIKQKTDTVYESDETPLTYIEAIQALFVDSILTSTVRENIETNDWLRYHYLLFIAIGTQIERTSCHLWAPGPR